ncbi:hypothetical protein BUALT_Bualt01G0226100 [Buddleja alternifolia]|uniref:AT-hook motif nuclear-localized protein n=1 Tax=Buddleja alternifolia TaxID=168488 RepID=A0AAV6YK52_9LAMI|nr:hypothetical protein BUALT_Bualt01G0226100 [Buddleja alternifolia]
MDQRESMMLSGSSPYYMHRGTSESITGLQSPPSMSPLSNPAMHFQSNAGDSLNVPMDNSSTMSAHGLRAGPPSAMLQGEPVRRKRGRPRKYGGHGGPVSLPIVRPTQKRRGSPPKQKLSTLGSSLFNGGGTMAPHIITIAVGEDIKGKILSLLQGRGAIVILSGIGSISVANIKFSSSGGSVTYEGHFDMLHLSGSYINDVDGPHGSTGGLNVTLAGPDGRVVGGPVEGILVAASPVQVIVGSLSPRASKSKTKAAEDSDHGAIGNSLTPATIQPSQHLSPLGAWPGS